MAFKTFAPGVLTSSDVNTFLMRQAVIVCTSSTRPASPNEGMTIYETDTDRYKAYSGTAWEDTLKSGAWISYTPVLLPGSEAGTDWALGSGTITGAYQKAGRMVVVRLALEFASDTTFGTRKIALTAPVVKVVEAVGNRVVGTVVFEDVSAGNTYSGVCLMQATGSILALAAFEITVGTYSQSALASGSIPFTWATGDRINIDIIYEAAA